MVKMYTIYDKVVGKYRTPFFCASNDFDAIRLVRNSLDDPNNLLSKNMSDFSLYHICDYNDESSVFDVKNSKKVAEIVDIVTKKE